MSVLRMLAAHNEWANRRVFAACSELDPSRLAEASDAYDSVVGILTHLVQVEHAFFELAHGRAPTRIQLDGLTPLREECGRIDRAYVDYASTLDPAEADTKCFVVPWFGFEVTLTEGVLQPLTHSHKHRADVSMLLPRLGGAGVEMDLIQWLDEQRGSTRSTT
ncbi:MAG TPA: DinB family protein [Actinomycetota bacterium]|nr:DinB family protein [Actinomycetota bacterium]